MENSKLIEKWSSNFFKKIRLKPCLAKKKEFRKEKKSLTCPPITWSN
jgi:hypothetical protein